MSDLRDLYQELIVDHYRHPHNFGPLAGANRRAEGFNPLCGDRLTLYLQVCLLYTSPSPRDGLLSRMPSSA